MEAKRQAVFTDRVARTLSPVPELGHVEVWELLWQESCGLRMYYGHSNEYGRMHYRAAWGPKPPDDDWGYSSPNAAYWALDVRQEQERQRL